MIAGGEEEEIVGRARGITEGSHNNQGAGELHFDGSFNHDSSPRGSLKNNGGASLN